MLDPACATYCGIPCVNGIYYGCQTPELSSGVWRNVLQVSQAFVLSGCFEMTLLARHLYVRFTIFFRTHRVFRCESTAISREVVPIGELTIKAQLYCRIPDDIQTHVLPSCTRAVPPTWVFHRKTAAPKYNFILVGRPTSHDRSRMHEP